MQRAPNRSILRITLATAVAVLMSTTLIGCNREGDTATTTAGPGEAARDERAGEMQPSAQQPMGQQEMSKSQPGMGGQQGTQPGMGQQGMGQQGMGTGAQDIMAQRGTEACPMMVQGASIDVEDTADGVALRFTSSTPADVDDLRNRVQHMARMYEMQTGEEGQAGSMMWHRMGHMRADQDQGAAGQQQGPTGVMPAAVATVEEIDNGVRLVLKPKNNEQLSTLREHARDHERRMESGECWMAQQAGAEGQGAQGRTDSGQVGDDKPGHRPGESAPGDGRPKT
jgi:hypothetical protein